MLGSDIFFLIHRCVVCVLLANVNESQFVDDTFFRVNFWQHV